MSRIQENKKYYLFENLTGKEDHSCCFYYDLRKDGMIFHFDVEDEDIVSPFAKDNEDIWQGDAVEIFLSPNGDRLRYLEIEISPFGIRFCGKIFNHDGKTPRLEKIPPNFSAEAVISERGYTVTAELPYASLEGYEEDKMIFNAFRLDKKRDGTQLLYALNPTLCRSFHRPAFFI